VLLAPRWLRDGAASDRSLTPCPCAPIPPIRPCLSARPRLVFDYFTQRVRAGLTNPLWTRSEEVSSVTSLRPDGRHADAQPARAGPGSLPADRASVPGESPADPWPRSCTSTTYLAATCRGLCTIVIEARLLRPRGRRWRDRLLNILRLAGPSAAIATPLPPSPFLSDRISANVSGCPPSRFPVRAVDRASVDLSRRDQPGSTPRSRHGCFTGQVASFT